ncbi:hypothetical protein BGX27_007067 [Mortierella sp. AM989]|nr:hypothetical protein BGX27_007067 [Mortierella sp. AM989]
MSSLKQKRAGSRAKSSSPTSSPPMPPAPILAKNRGSASPRHQKTEVEPAVLKARTMQEPIQAPPAFADGDDLVESTVPIPGAKKGSVRRLVTSIFLVYLGYILFFVCPNPSAKDTNAVCEGVSKLQDWLRPYSEPAYNKFGETYRTYAEPYVDQYGRPLYSQGQKYYTDMAQPAFKMASEKARTSYNQYAHPHVLKATDAIYTDNMKHHLNCAQKTFKGYQQQAYGHIEHAKKICREKSEQIWQLYDEYIQPVVNKISPHVKVAWDHTSNSAGKAYDTASVLYMKHVNPYAQHSIAVILDAAANAKESFARHTDEIWGTRFSKQNQSKLGRVSSQAAKKANQVKEKAQEAAKQADKKANQVKEKAQEAAKQTEKKAKQAKADADAQAESFKDTLLKKATEAQKLAGEYAEEAKDAIQDTVAGAQKVASEYSDSIKAAVAGAVGGAASKKVADEPTVTESVAKAAQDAQKAAADEAERLRKLAEAKTHEAGKISEKIKKTILQKAHEAQEAVARQAENIRTSAQEQAHRVQEAGANLVDSMVGASHGAKEAVDNQAEHIAKVAQEKQEEAKKTAQDASQQAQKAFDTAAQHAENIKAKIVDSGKAAEKSASEKAEDVRDKAEDIREKIVESGKAAGESAREKVEDLRDKAEDVRENIVESGKTAGKSASKKIEDVRDKVVESGKAAGKSGSEKVEEIKDKVIETGNVAGKVANEKVEDIKKAAQGHAKDAQEFTQEKAKSFFDSTEQIVMDGKEHLDHQVENANKAKDYVTKKAMDAGEQIDNAKETVKNKVHDANTASKAQLAAMLAGIEATFGKFYEYEDTETKNLWSNLQGSIDEHITAAKNSARDLEKANREAYEAFESYVRDWRNQGGNLEDRLAELHHHSVESIKNIVHQADDDQTAAKSKAQVLSNNVEVYLSGLKSFLEDRLAASKETVASELSVFKDTSSKDDENTLSAKILELEQAAKGKLSQAGEDAHSKVQELLKQVRELWNQSEAKSQEYVQLTRQLAKEAREEAKASFQNDPNIRIATEEPGSGHRHHRH